MFERYRDADAAIEHFSNISHLMEPIMATASVTGEVLGTPNAKMKAQLGKDEAEVFTPWMTPGRFVSQRDCRNGDAALSHASRRSDESAAD